MTTIKTKLMAGFLLAAGALFAGPRISIGVGFGAPVVPYYAPAPVVAPAYVAPAYVPPPYPVAPAPLVAPGPGYTWAAGYWYGAGPHRVWRPGYWVAPRGYVGGRGWYRR